MPCIVVFHKRYALSLDRMGDDGCRLSLGLSGFLKSCFDFIKVMTVDLDRMETECFKLGFERFRADHIVDVAIDLQMVVV